MKYIYFFLCISLVTTTIIAQTETRFSDVPFSNRRISTSEQDKNSDILMPQYDAIASEPDKGITLQDWEKHYLSPSTFALLDENQDKILTKEELENDSFLGEVQQYEQTKELVEKFAKPRFTDFSERIKVLKKQGYTNIDRTDNYIANKKQEFYDNIPPSAIKCEYPNCNQIATHLYVQVRDGQVVRQYLDVGHYALLLMEDQEKDECMALPLALLGVIAIVIVVVFLFK